MGLRRLTDEELDAMRCSRLGIKDLSQIREEVTISPWDLEEVIDSMVHSKSEYQVLEFRHGNLEVYGDEISFGFPFEEATIALDSEKSGLHFVFYHSGLGIYLKGLREKPLNLRVPDEPNQYVKKDNEVVIERLGDAITKVRVSFNPQGHREGEYVDDKGRIVVPTFDAKKFYTYPIIKAYKLEES